jgi:hypothetical protein
MDTTPLKDAYGAFLDAAATVARAGGRGAAPLPGEWNATQVLAHVSLISATTIAATAAVASGALATYDNRISQDPWTIERLIGQAAGGAGLAERIRCQARALCSLGPALTGEELDTPVPTLLVSHGEPLVNQPLPLRDLIEGLAAAELPGHTRQLLALLPDPALDASAP